MGRRTRERGREVLVMVVPPRGKDAAAELKDVLALGRLGSGVMVVRRVSHWSAAGLTLRVRSPRPSMLVSLGGMFSKR